MPTCNIEQDVSIYYELSGRGKECCIFISGTGFHSGVWKPFQVPHFSKEYTVLISDHRGVGASSKPDIPYSTRMFADDIVRLMDALGINDANLIGHSMGGRVAQWIAIEHSKRVRKLVLAASGSGNFSGRSDYIRGIPLDTALEIAEKGYENYFRGHVESEFFFSPEFKQRDWEKYSMAVRCHVENMPPLKPYLRHVIARQMHETSSRLGEIRAKTLVLAGEDDRRAYGTGSHYEAALFLSKGIPNARLEFVPRTRHGFFWEAPEASNEFVSSFLEKND